MSDTPQTSIDFNEVIVSYMNELRDIKHTLIVTQVALKTEQATTQSLRAELGAAQARVHELEVEVNQPTTTVETDES